MGFWGSSKTPDSDLSPTASGDFVPETQAASNNMAAFAPSTSDPKTAVMQQIQQEAAVSNARALIDKLNEHCFERCVPSPTSSLSNGEQQCFTQCMEKYMAAWNAVSRVYVTKLQEGGGGVLGGM